MISEYGTSSPSSEQTRMFLIRASSFLCKKLKRRSFVRTAVKSFTGIVTRPKFIAPDQIACATVLPPAFSRFRQRRFEPLPAPAPFPRIPALAENRRDGFEVPLRPFACRVGHAFATERFYLVPGERQ